MRIVIAEDEPKSREGLIRLIRRFTDYEIVGVAENGEEGYRLTEKEKPDLVLSDIKMRYLTDWACCRRSRMPALRCRLCC